MQPCPMQRSDSRNSLPVLMTCLTLTVLLENMTLTPTWSIRQRTRHLEGDLIGRPLVERKRPLDDLHGSKVLLLAWASW